MQEVMIHPADHENVRPAVDRALGPVPCRARAAARVSNMPGIGSAHGEQCSGGESRSLHHLLFLPGNVPRKAIALK